MVAAKFDVFAEQGADFTLNTRWKTGDPSAVVDIQSYSAACEGRTTYPTTTTLFNLSTTNGGIAIDVNNYIKIKIPHTVTSALDFTKGKKVSITDPNTGVVRIWYRIGVWDLEVTAPNAITTRLLYGDVYVSPEVTR